jgi:hypothetical protein
MVIVAEQLDGLKSQISSQRSVTSEVLHVPRPRWKGVRTIPCISCSNLSQEVDQLSPRVYIRE